MFWQIFTTTFSDIIGFEMNKPSKLYVPDFPVFLLVCTQQSRMETRNRARDEENDKGEEGHILSLRDYCDHS